MSDNRRYCPKCGSELSRAANFCDSCGTNVRDRYPEATDSTHEQTARGSDRIPGIDSSNTRRRNVLVGGAYAIAGLAALGAIVPEPEDESDDGDGGGSTDGDGGPDDSTGNSAGSGDETATRTPTPEPEMPELVVRITYEFEWQGSISVTDSDGSSSRSVSGTGNETIEVSTDADIVSANAQKQDQGNEELSIAIVQDGEVLTEESTTAEFGLAQVSVRL